MIWWLVPLLIPLAYLVQVLVHEGSHALMASFQGFEITSFRFWPHTIDTIEGGRRFLFGRVTYKLPEGAEWPSDFETLVRAWAPFIVSIPLIITLAVLAAIVSVPVLKTIFAVWMVAALIDVVRGLLQAWRDDDYLDINKGRLAMNIPVETVRWCASISILLLVLICGFVIAVLI